MPGIGLKIDPVGEDAANVVLDLNDGTKFRAMEAKYPTPDRDVNWSSSADTEGGLPAHLRYQNRTITIVCRVTGSSASDLQTQLGYLEQKVGKINDERGTHEYVSPSGVVCVFDLLEAAADYEIDNAALANKRTVVTITFTAKPFWRSGLANEVAGSDHTETTLPVVVGVDTSIGGDVPALGRLVVDDDQGADQLTLLWGLQSRYYDSSADAALFYEAESRTPQGGAATAALAGASGGGNNTVLATSLIPSYQSILSTQASGEGNHLKHVGSYRVFARLQRPASNTGSVSVCLEWMQGDFLKGTQNAAVMWGADELEGVWTLVDLGLVHLDKVTAGAQRWEGRLLARSSVAGDDIYADCLMLFPVDEGYGSLKIAPPLTIPTVVAAHDEFDQSAGNLDTPKALPVGGNWSEVTRTGANGFAVETTGHTARRTTVSDADLDSGCIALAGTSTYSAVQVGVTISVTKLVTQEQMRFGVLARYNSTEKWLMAALIYLPEIQEDHGPSQQAGVYLAVMKRNAGAATIIGKAFYLGGKADKTQISKAEVSLTVNGAGVWTASVGSVSISGQDADLATGGALASGKVGMYDAWTSSTANTRSFDNFIAFAVSSSDAVVYSKQSAEVRWDRMLREDAAGLLWVPRKDYKGKYFTAPPSRREARSIRTIVKLSRGNIDSMADSAIDDASFRIYWQSRGLVLPES